MWKGTQGKGTAKAAVQLMPREPLKINNVERDSGKGHCQGCCPTYAKRAIKN